MLATQQTFASTQSHGETTARLSGQIQMSNGEPNLYGDRQCHQAVDRPQQVGTTISMSVSQETRQSTQNTFRSTQRHSYWRQLTVRPEVSTHWQVRSSMKVVHLYTVALHRPRHRAIRQSSHSQVGVLHSRRYMPTRHM